MTSHESFKAASGLRVKSSCVKFGGVSGIRIHTHPK